MIMVIMIWSHICDFIDVTVRYIFLYIFCFLLIHQTTFYCHPFIFKSSFTFGAGMRQISTKFYWFSSGSYRWYSRKLSLFFAVASFFVSLFNLLRSWFHWSFSLLPFCSFCFRQKNKFRNLRALRWRSDNEKNLLQCCRLSP